MDSLDMARDVAHISGDTLRWARLRAGLEPQAIADLLGRGHTAEQVLAWESGNSFPTFSQAELIADKLRVPFAILFMEQHPEIAPPIRDLRTVSGVTEAPPSLDFLDLLNDCVVRQRWYREEQIFNNARPLEFVARFQLNSDINALAADIGNTLGINDALRHECNSWQEFLAEFTKRAENAGVLVMRSSVVRHASRRNLQVTEFRGFAISDVFAPLVFVNTADARSAQIFTLAHELVHIWIGQSGISNADPKRRADDFVNDIEKFCNKVAAQLLVPAANVSRLWQSGDSVERNLQRIATFHRVSKTVAAIRVRDMNRISFETASKIIEAENKRFAEQKMKAKEKEGGPTFWTTFAPRNSVRLTETVVSALRAGRVFYMDAAHLLGTKVSTLQNYLNRIASR